MPRGAGGEARAELAGHGDPVLLLLRLRRLVFAFDSAPAPGAVTLAMLLSSSKARLLPDGGGIA